MMLRRRTSVERGVSSAERGSRSANLCAARCALHAPRHAAFTLLEFLLAISLGVLLLGLIYQGLDTQTSNAEAGRELIQQGALARGVFSRIENDIVNNLGPAAPSSSSSAPTDSTAATDSAAAANGAAQSGDTAQNTAAYAAPVFNTGIQGSGQYLSLALSRLPREAGNPEKPSCDLRRIDYWMADGGGLARREVLAITSDAEMVDSSTLADQKDFVFAPEVRSLTLRFWDGSAWQETWDGTQLGPPAAIEITIEMATSANRTRKYQHVVPVPAASIVQPAS